MTNLADSKASKSDRVRALLKEGISPGDIAKQVGCSRNLVYIIKSGMKSGVKSTAAKSGGARSVGRKGNTAPAAAGFGASLDGIVRAVQQSQRDTAAMRDGLTRIQQIVAQLLQ